MSNKSVSFGGVFHFPTPPKPSADTGDIGSNKKDIDRKKDVGPKKDAERKKDVGSKKDTESKSVSIKNRFNCGSLRNSLKMVSSQGSTLIAIRLVRSKLRKREDTLPTTTTATPTATSTTTTAVNTTPTNLNNNVIQHSNNHILSNGLQQNHTNQQQQTDTADGPAPPFLWVYHTNGTSTTNSSQYTLYNNDQDTLVHNLQCEEARECKGFRKNLRGKWRRLVKKKPQQEVYTIPAELRDQLKQIYVY